MYSGKLHLCERLNELAKEMREIAALMAYYTDDPMFVKHSDELTWAASVADNWIAEIEKQA